MKIVHLEKSEIIKLLSDESHQSDLLEHADNVRRQNVGDEVHLRGLIEFSNICRNNCLYCGIRKDNLAVKRYRMSEDELILTAQSMKLDLYRREIR